MEQQQGPLRRLLDRFGFNKGKDPRGPLPIHYLRQYDRMIHNAQVARGEIDQYGRRIPRDKRPW